MVDCSRLDDMVSSVCLIFVVIVSQAALPRAVSSTPGSWFAFSMGWRDNDFAPLSIFADVCGTFCLSAAHKAPTVQKKALLQARVGTRVLRQ
jgi:hypothetical protein